MPLYCGKRSIALRYVDELLSYWTATNHTGQTMRTAKRFGLLLDLVLLAASIATGSPVGVQVERLAILIVAIVGALAIFCLSVLAIALLDQRKAPYRI
jgi:predicted membrane channel-forming protein YqfA (hemolysin III family)